MIIHVTQDDIDKGQCEYPTRCPIALAAWRLFSDELVYVGDNLIQIGERHFRLPETAQYFIERFDGGESVAPFEFELVD